MLGPDHRRTGNTYAVVALVHEARGEYAQALETSDLALQILAAADGEDAPSVAGVRRNAAIMAIHSGDYERGERDFRRVLESSLATLGPEHPDTATAWGNLAGGQRRDRVCDVGVIGRQHALTQGERLAGVALRLLHAAAHAHDARLVLAYALTARGRERERVRTLVEEAIEKIEGLAAPAERELVEEIAREQGWTDLAEATAGASARIVRGGPSQKGRTRG